MNQPIAASSETLSFTASEHQFRFHNQAHKLLCSPTTWVQSDGDLWTEILSGNPPQPPVIKKAMVWDVVVCECIHNDSKIARVVWLGYL
jgi:hypothetical protein